MRSVYSFALSAVATLAAAASTENPFNNPAGGYDFTAGESTTITWDPTTSGTVTLKLQYGDNLTPNSGETIISHLPNSGSYTWTVPSDVADESDYTIEIISDSNPDETNYMPRFTITGATATSSSVTSTTTTTTTTSSSTTTTTTKSKTTESSVTPSPTTTTTTQSKTKTTSSATETPSATATNVPDTNGAMANRVSGGLVALVMGALAVF